MDLDVRSIGTLGRESMDVNYWIMIIIFCELAVVTLLPTPHNPKIPNSNPHNPINLLTYNFIR